MGLGLCSPCNILLSIVIFLDAHTSSNRILLPFRQALTNVYQMLQSGGQFFFNAAGETPNDEIYERLDKGEWSKYYNRSVQSAFYNSANPKIEYEKLITSLGFTDVHIFNEPVTAYFDEDALIGNFYF